MMFGLHLPGATHHHLYVFFDTRPDAEFWAIEHTPPHWRIMPDTVRLANPPEEMFCVGASFGTLAELKSFCASHDLELQLGI